MRARAPGMRAVTAWMWTTDYGYTRQQAIAHPGAESREELAAASATPRLPPRGEPHAVRLEGVNEEAVVVGVEVGEGVLELTGYGPGSG